MRGKLIFPGTVIRGNVLTFWPKPVKSGAGRVVRLKVLAAMVSLDAKPSVLFKSKLTASCWP